MYLGYAKWHLAEWPLPTERSCGTSVLQRASAIGRAARESGCDHAIEPRRLVECTQIEIKLTGIRHRYSV
jgi:hypothetical protein